MEKVDLTRLVVDEIRLEKAEQEGKTVLGMA